MSYITSTQWLLSDRQNPGHSGEEGDEWGQGLGFLLTAGNSLFLVGLVASSGTRRNHWGSSHPLGLVATIGARRIHLGTRRIQWDSPHPVGLAATNGTNRSHWDSSLPQGIPFFGFGILRRTLRGIRFVFRCHFFRTLDRSCEPNEAERIQDGTKMIQEQSFISATTQSSFRPWKAHDLLP